MSHHGLKKQLIKIAQKKIFIDIGFQTNKNHRNVIWE